MLDFSRQESVTTILPSFEVLSKERQLEFESSLMTDEMMQQVISLLSKDSSETRYLGLSNTKLGKHIGKLAQTIAANDKIEYLDLSFNDLHDPTVDEHLLPALAKNRSIISLNLRGNDLKHRTLSAVEVLLRRNQHYRTELLTARMREQQAMLREEISVRNRHREVGQLVADMQATQQRRLERMDKLRHFWAREVAKAEARELQLLSTLQIEADERKEGRKGKKGKKSKK